MATSKEITVGVLALQGAFAEHHDRLRSLRIPDVTLCPLLVKLPSDLALCSALIIPGGESTSIALGAERAGLLEPLRQFVREGRPVWGTCAGMIMLAAEANRTKKGGQELIGGMDFRVERNSYGSQVDSFSYPLTSPYLSNPTEPFPGIFIRAPIVHSLLSPSELPTPPLSSPSSSGPASSVPTPTATEGEDEGDVNAKKSITAPALQNLPPFSLLSSRPPIEVLCKVPEPLLASNPAPTTGDEKASATPTGSMVSPSPEDSRIVALKQGRLMATSFHPELTTDSRWHELFVRKCVLEA